jgi:hypothetical protein
MGNGSKVLKWILLSPVVLFLLGIVFCEINKAYWNHQVRLMCEKDGGVTVYEHIELTQDEFNLLGGFNGYIRAPVEKYAKKFDLYISTSVHDQIHDINPYVYRSKITIFRRSDKKNLGEEISYSRVGGDFPTGIMHESSFSCGDMEGFNVNITKSIFSVKGE